MNVRLLLTITLAISLCGATDAQERRKKAANYPPRLEGAKVEVYKKIGDVELNIYIYNPTDHQPTDQRPAAVFSSVAAGSQGRRSNSSSSASTSRLAAWSR